MILAPKKSKRAQIFKIEAQRLSTFSEGLKSSINRQDMTEQSPSHYSGFAVA